jgi:hypothetical protein
MLKTMLVGCFLLLPCVAQAGGWNCRNEDFEIRCMEGKCTAEPEGGFTPFQVSVGAGGASLSICAYSGCWEGNARPLKSGHHLLVSGRHLKWSGTVPSPADFMVAIDLADKIGFVKGEGFAMPMTCTAAD